MVDGKLTEMGREPHNTQMLVAEVERNGDGHTSLQDETRTFLEVAETDASEPNRSLTDNGVSKLDGLRMEMEKARTEQSWLAE